jgi:hypothetical protein
VGSWWTVTQCAAISTNGTTAAEALTAAAHGGGIEQRDESMC